MNRRTLTAWLVPVLAVGCSAGQPAVEELRPAAVVQTAPPDPPNFQSELLPGAPRIAEAAANPTRGGQYPIGRAGNPVPPGPRVAPVPVPQESPPAPPPTPDMAATTTTTTAPSEAPTTTTSAQAGDPAATGAQPRPSTTTTTAPVLEPEGIAP